MISSMWRPVSTGWFCIPFRVTFQPGAHLPAWRYVLPQPAVFSATEKVCWSISPTLRSCRQPARFCWKTDRPSSAAADGSVKPAKPSSLMPEHCPAAYNMILIFYVLQPLIHRYKEQQPLVLFSNQRLLSCFCLFFSFSLPLPSAPQTAHRNRSLCHTEADKTASEFPCWSAAAARHPLSGAPRSVFLSDNNAIRS